MISALELTNRWFDEVWNKGNDDAIDELFPADAVLHDGGMSIVGPDAFRRFREAFRSAFSDIRITILRSVAQGDDVCVRWSASMIHSGEFAGHRPTGNRIEITGMSMVHTANGQMVEAWQNWDMLGLLEAVREQERPAPTYMAAHM